MVSGLDRALREQRPQVVRSEPARVGLSLILILGIGLVEAEPVWLGCVQTLLEAHVRESRPELGTLGLASSAALLCSGLEPGRSRVLLAAPENGRLLAALERLLLLVFDPLLLALDDGTELAVHLDGAALVFEVVLVGTEARVERLQVRLGGQALWQDRGRVAQTVHGGVW